VTLKAYELSDRCPRSRESAHRHWHHVCWYCRADLCAAVSAVTSDGRYDCSRCGCGETEHTFIQTDAGFDLEVAAALSSPA
jgi:hypothetical protein